MPRDTIRFSNLNDNIDRKFLHELCEVYGDIIEYKVYFDPQNNKHMGTGKVVFDANTNADQVVSLMDGRSVMGNEIKAWIDVKSELNNLGLMKELFYIIGCSPKDITNVKKIPYNTVCLFMKVYISLYVYFISLFIFKNICFKNANFEIIGMYIHLFNVILITIHYYLLFYFCFVDPPGHSLLKQLEVECLARDAKIAAASHARNALPITSSDQSTPLTPSVGALHRNHPVASSYNRHNRRDKLPPPPPPKSSNSKSYGRHSGPKTPPPVSNHKGPSTPPPPPPGSHYKRRSRNTQYSPVSDQSGSPKSPKHHVNTASYEAISDTESKHVQDISPVLSTDGKQQVINNEDEDDNMSLSPISPTDGNSKVELNIQNISQKNLLSSNNMNNITAGFPLGQTPVAPSQNFTSQTFFPQPQPPGNMPTPPSGAPPNYIPPPHPSFNHQTLPPFQGPGPGMHQQNNSIPPTANNMLPQRPNPQQNHLQNEQRPNPLMSLSQEPNYNFRHKELAEYLKRNHASFVASTNHQQQQQQQQQQQPMLPKHDRGRHREHEHLQHRMHNHTPVESPVNERHSEPQPTMESLPFVFQVKAGCARDISQDLKRILSKDTLKRLVEQSAFQAYENWWVKQKSLSEPKQQQLEMKERSDQPATNVSKETTSVEEMKSNPWDKNKQALTEIVQSMFGQDKSFNNHHNSSFLSSFRISRRPSASRSNRTKSQTNQHRKRHARAWPSMKEDGRTGKLQRIEESDEEDTDEEDDRRKNNEQNNGMDDDSSSSSDDQFEQFLKQSKFLPLLYHGSTF